MPSSMFASMGPLRLRRSRLLQDITLTGDFGPQGPGTVDVQFLNDAWGGTSATDRNVQSIDVNGTATFNINHTAPPKIMG